MTATDTNVFAYKYLHSLRHPDRFAYHTPLILSPPDNLHHPDTALLSLAEAAAFGGVGREGGDLRLNYWKVNAEQSETIRAVSKQLYSFIRAHGDLYEGYRAYADVGIVFHDLPYEPSGYGREELARITDLAEELAGRGLLWNVLTENRCHAAGFAHLKALIYQDVARIGEAEAQAVQSYLERGGLVIASGVVGDIDEWFHMRLPVTGGSWPPVGSAPAALGERGRDRPAAFRQPVGAGRLLYEPGPLAAESVITALETHMGRTVRLIEGAPAPVVERLRLSAWMSSDGRRMTVHVVNYSAPLGLGKARQVQALVNLEIRLPLPSGMQAHSVMLYSPEADMPSNAQVDFSADAGNMLRFAIPLMRVYTMAKVTLSPPR